jgi:hypothetical protein
MLFSLTNVLVTCIRLINNVLAGYLDVFVIVYLDNILVYSETKKEHIAHIKKVLRLLREYNLLFKPKKCEFHVKRTEFLGFIVSTKGLLINPEKVKAVIE